jgi:hypothetical protein
MSITIIASGKVILPPNASIQGKDVVVRGEQGVHIAQGASISGEKVLVSGSVVDNQGCIAGSALAVVSGSASDGNILLASGNYVFQVRVLGLNLTATIKNNRTNETWTSKSASISSSKSVADVYQLATSGMASRDPVSLVFNEKMRKFTITIKGTVVNFAM